MEERLLHLDAEDGHRLPYRVWEPEGAPRATVVVLNGIMSHSAWFSPLAPGLMDAGCRVVGADRRGSGRDEVGRGDAPSASVVTSDALAIIEHERREGVPTFLVAWCWGSVLAMNLLAKLPLDGLVLLAPGLFPTKEVQDGAVVADAEAEGRPEDEPCVAIAITEDMFTTGEHLEGFVRADPLRLRFITPRFRALMTKLAIGAVARLRRLDVPTLVLLASRDRATDNEATRAGLARAPEGILRIEEIESAHGIQFDAPDALTRAILGFLAERGAFEDA